MTHFDAKAHRGNGHAVAQVAVTAELVQALSAALVARLGGPAGERAPVAGKTPMSRALSAVHPRVAEDRHWDQAMDAAFTHVMGFAFDPRSHTQAALRRSACELARATAGGRHAGTRG